MPGTRHWGIGLAAGVLLLLGACAQPAPSSLQPSISPSPTDTPTDGLDTTIVPATPPAPTPHLNGEADVVVAVDNARIAYAVSGCPVTAWLDDRIEDEISFGAYPDYLTADDGTLWSTSMVVLGISNGAVTDWSFRLTSPLSGIPGDAVRSLVSLPDPDISIDLAITVKDATFTTGFWDSATSGELAPQPVAGIVTVTCR
jgi:hypothetical protein